MKWALIGDSEAVGLQGPLAQELHAQGYDLAGYVAEIGWQTGRMVREGRDRVITATRDADLVVIVLGGNDEPTPELALKIGDLVGLARTTRSPRIVWVGPAHTTRPDLAARKAEVAAIQRATMPKLGAEWINGYVTTRDLEHAPDGVHFTASARAIWASRIANEITNSRSRGLVVGALAGAAVAGLGLLVYLGRGA